MFSTKAYLICILAFLTLSSFGYSQSNQVIKGLTVVAPPRSFEKDPFKVISNINANWITLVPYGFTSDGSTKIRYNLDRQWWGEKEVGIIECIKMAKANDLSVMLKPQVYMHNSWVGEYDPQSEKGWKEWEANYREYILFYAKIAAEHEVDLFCIGTEYRVAIQKREAFWRSLISEIRNIYCGGLTYSSNWDGYEKVKIWDALDYIGLSAYFPLSSDKTPKKRDLLNKWKPIVKELEKYSAKWDRPILFTEYGYLSVDGAAGKTWELEKVVRNLPINEEAQKIALDALYESFWNKDFWKGGFMWKWFPEMQGHEGYPDRDYTPQGKKAEKIIKEWFSK